jgi:hypothetical protein
MHLEVGHVEGLQLIVRPELVASTLRFLDLEAKTFSDELWELGATLASAAEDIRAGKSINLAVYPTSHDAKSAQMFPDRVRGRWTFGDWLVNGGIKAVFESAHDREGSRNDCGRGDDWDWRYLSDLAALAADIEAVVLASAG